MIDKEKLDFIWKHARKPEFKDSAFIIDPNNWNDVQSWFEDKQEHWDLVVYFGMDYIEKIAKEKELNLIDAVECIWKEKYEYEK